LSVDGGFKDHFVVRVGQLGPPYEANFHGQDAAGQFRQEPVDELQG